jgi:hypothetical protein
MGFGFVIGFIEPLQNLTTNNYDSLTNLHTPKTTVTTAHINNSESSLAVAQQRLPTLDVPLTLASQTLPGLSYQLLSATAHKD